ncbi:MAG TPA: tautomerase family protein [Nitrososphaeraceae archaeon]|nr:tautomerase family protein [Nitrososphaeraceae archaeon]
MPLIQISTYPERTREQKEAFAKAITNAALEILKAERQHVTITYDQRPSENWYFSGEQSRERRDFGIPRMCIQHKEI